MVVLGALHAKLDSAPPPSEMGDYFWMWLCGLETQPLRPVREEKYRWRGGRHRGKGTAVAQGKRRSQVWTRLGWMNSASGLRDGYSTRSLEFSEKSVRSVAQPPIHSRSSSRKSWPAKSWSALEVSGPPDKNIARRKCGQALENCLFLEAGGWSFWFTLSLPSSDSKTLVGGASLCLELPVGAFVGFHCREKHGYCSLDPTSPPWELAVALFPKGHKFHLRPCHSLWSLAFQWRFPESTN